MGHVGSKTRSPGQILGNSCLHSRGHICDPILIKLFQNVLTISRPSSDIGYVRSETRSPGKILGNACLHSRGYICDPILMKFGQNVCFDKVLTISRPSLNMGHVGSKTRSPGQILENSFTNITFTF